MHSNQEIIRDGMEALADAIDGARNGFGYERRIAEGAIKAGRAAYWMIGFTHSDSHNQFLNTSNREGIMAAIKEIGEFSLRLHGMQSYLSKMIPLNELSSDELAFAKRVNP